MTNTKGALSRIEEALDKIASFSTPNYERIDAAQEALALIKEMQEEVPGELIKIIADAEHDYRVGNTVNPNDFDEIVETAALVQKWLAEPGRMDDE